MGIEKGSVLVVRVPGDADPKKYHVECARGLGAFRAEGFGEVILNPAFLKADEATGEAGIRFEEKIQCPAPTTLKTGVAEKDDPLVRWVRATKEAREKEEALFTRIRTFVAKNGETYRKISASQWGAIRALAVAATGKDDLLDKLFREDLVKKNRQGDDRVIETGGFLMHGKSLKVWRGKPREVLSEKLKQEGEDTLRPFIIRLCGEMAKETRRANQSKEQRS
jgi:hypothetical protein